MPADEQGSSTSALGVFSRGFKGVLGIVRKNHDTEAFIGFVGTGHPIKGGVEGVHGSNAGKGHVDNITGLETIIPEPLGVALGQHVHDVGRRRFGSVEG